MKKHHLDERIKVLIDLYDQEEVIEFDLIDHLICIYQEIKRLDEVHESLSDWVHDYDS